MAVIVVGLAILSRRRGNRLPTKDSVIPDDLSEPLPDADNITSVTHVPAPTTATETRATREVNQ
jgi:hypothetical protein